MGMIRRVKSETVRKMKISILISRMNLADVNSQADNDGDGDNKN